MIFDVEHKIHTDSKSQKSDRFVVTNGGYTVLQLDRRDAAKLVIRFTEELVPEDECDEETMRLIRLMAAGLKAEAE